jgi:hypothetical protein
LDTWAGATIRGLNGGGEGLFQSFFGQAEPGLDAGRVAFIDVAAALQPEQGLDLSNDFPARGLGFEPLPEKALEGQAQAKDGAHSRFVGRDAFHCVPDSFAREQMGTQWNASLPVLPTTRECAHVTQCC